MLMKQGKMKKDEKKIKKVLHNPCNPLLCPYRQRDNNQLTDMKNCSHLRHRWQKAIKVSTSVCASGDSNDEAAEELLRNNKQSESLQLAINLLCDARALAEIKLAKKISKGK